MEAPPVISSTNTRPRSAWWMAAALAAAAAGGVLLYLFNPSRYGFYPRCPLYVTTGLLCPGCGSQRALYYLVHGQLGTALRCNALLMLSLPFAAIYAMRCVKSSLTGAPLPQIAPRPRTVWLVTGVLTVFAILRNIPCAPFIYLAPP